MKIEPWSNQLTEAVHSLYQAQIEGGHPLWQKVALKTRGLTVYCDMGGCLAITPSGEVLAVHHDQDKVWTVNAGFWVRVARVEASKKHEELSCLGHNLPSMKDCMICGGTGYLADRSGCTECEGSGFVEA